jgi:hypothetical protein
MASGSPRQRESLDYEDPDTIDPHLSLGLGSFTIDSAGHEGQEPSRQAPKTDDPTLPSAKLYRQKLDALKKLLEPKWLPNPMKSSTSEIQVLVGPRHL